MWEVDKDLIWTYLLRIKSIEYQIIHHFHFTGITDHIEVIADDLSALYTPYGIAVEPMSGNIFVKRFMWYDK